MEQLTNFLKALENSKEVKSDKHDIILSFDVNGTQMSIKVCSSVLNDLITKAA